MTNAGYAYSWSPYMVAGDLSPLDIPSTFNYQQRLHMAYHSYLFFWVRQKKNQTIKGPPGDYARKTAPPADMPLRSLADNAMRCNA